MKPIRLVMNAFGPYAGKEEINFGILEEKKLFLITGPTGSGKTTIFDAISFALYGEASGSERSVEGLRSQFAQDTDMTYVSLKFELGGLEYEVKRIPKQQKPKTRGTGYTEQPASAELTISDVQGEKIVTGIKDVNEKIESLLGISSDQFRQIMMIPQGDFRRLLTEDSQEREKVLQKIFNTSVYRMLQMELAAMEKSLHFEIKNEIEVIERLVPVLDCSCCEKLKELVGSDSRSIAEIVACAKGLVESDRMQVEDLAKAMRDERAQADIVAEEIRIANKNNEDIARLESVKKRLEGELERSEDIQKLKFDVERAQKAFSIQGFDKNLNDRRNELDIKKAELAKVLENSMIAAGEYQRLNEEYEAANSERAKELRKGLEGEVSRLSEYAERVAQMAKLEEETKTLGAECVSIQVKIEQDKAGLRAVKEHVQRLSEERENSIRASLQIHKKALLLAKLEERKNSVKRLMELKTMICKANERLKVEETVLAIAKSKYDQQAKRLANMEKTYSQNQAASLAKGLREGRPCPVCGSTHHEILAMHIEDAPSHEDIENARRIAQAMSAEKSRVETEIALLIQDIRRNEEEFGRIQSGAIGEAIHEYGQNEIAGYLNSELENLEIELNETEAQVEDLKGKGQMEREYEAEIAIKNEMVAAIESGIEKLATERDLKRENHASQKALLEQIYSNVPKEFRDLAALKKLIDKKRLESEKESERFEMLRTDLEAATSNKNSLEVLAIQLQKDKAALQMKAEEAMAELLLRIEEAGFSGYEEYKSSVMEMEHLEHKLRIIGDYEKSVHSLRAQAKELEELTIGKTVVDTSAMEATKEERLRAYEEMMKKKAELESRISTNCKVLDEIAATSEKISVKEMEYSVVADLSRAANGKNSKQITFERYVLAAFLKDILIAANIRLSKMSCGRYELLRSEGLERKNKQSGLELEVLDNYTGKSRHVKTLSGGESFQASLAMALGLSDVVQSYCGGVRLDTMFIDEGFGTLDSESLDAAVDCLVDIQKSGRLVGIISHVAELKERIDARLEVSATSSGSSTEFVIM